MFAYDAYHQVCIYLQNLGRRESHHESFRRGRPGKRTPGHGPKNGGQKQKNFAIQKIIFCQNGFRSENLQPQNRQNQVNGQIFVMF